MKNIFKIFITWNKSIAKRVCKAWVQSEINDERIRQHKDECLKYYYSTMRM